METKNVGPKGTRDTFSARVAAAGTTPWVLVASGLLFIAVAVALPVVKDSELADEIFRPLLIVGIAELLLAVYGVRLSLERVDRNIARPRDDFAIREPPYSINQPLLDTALDTEVGTLFLICYGSNRFGQIIDTIATRLPHLHTEVIVCDPDKALHADDGDAIRELILELTPVDHIAIHVTPTLPTVRGALLRNAAGTNVWASASFYLAYARRRGLKSEGISPVLVSEVAGSHAMDILAAFLHSEFTRLATLGARARNDDQS